MNILYINHYAGSPEIGMEFRPYYLAREWIKKGHQVTIVGATYSHLRKKQPEYKGNITYQTIDGIPYIWLKTCSYKGNGIGRIRNMLSFVSKLYWMAGRLAREVCPDVVIASSTYPLDIYPAARIAKKARAKLVFEAHDLWPLTPMELGGYSKYHPFIMALQAAEDYACRKSDRVVSILPHADKYYITRGMAPEKFCHVPNGIVKEDWENPELIPPEYEKLLNELKNTGYFLVGYAGGLSISNAMHHVIDSVSFIENKKVKLIIMGDGIARTELEQQAERVCPGKVIFLKPISKKAIPTFLKHMDALIVSLQKTELYRYGISLNKIFDYMMAAHPIIAAVEENYDDTIRRANCGITVEPEDSKLIAHAIDTIVQMSEAERRALGDNGRRYVLAEHEYGVLADKFLKAIEL